MSAMDGGLEHETAGLSVNQQTGKQKNNWTLSDKATDLKAAAESGEWTRVDELLSAGDITKCDTEQSCLLHKLAAAPEVSLSLTRDILTKILKCEGNINLVDEHENTAIVLAANCGNTKMVMELLSRQAALPQDVTLLCSFLNTLTKPWSECEMNYMHELIVKLLWDRLKDTALHSCDTQLHHTLVRLAVTFHTSLVREMFVTQQQVNGVDNEGMAVLHRVAMWFDYKHIRLIHFLVTKGADINLQNVSGDTPLHVAAEGCYVWMMEVLLRLGAKSDVSNYEQRSVLHIAASDSFFRFNDILTLLVRNNNDINKKDREGNTALHLAALAGNMKFVKILLDHDARVDGVNNEQKTVLHMMAMPVNETSFNIVFCRNVLLLILKRGADIQKTDVCGNSAVHLAAKHDNWDLVKVLLKYVDNVSQPDNEGFNLLHRLVMSQSSLDKDLFYQLSHKGADINARCQTGDTAIHLAAKHQNWDMVKQLLEEGALVEELDNEGFHVLHRMAIGGGKQVCSNENIKNYLLSLFLEKVFNCNICCKGGDTVLHLAAKHNNWSMFERLVEHVQIIDKADSEGLTIIQRLVMCTSSTFFTQFLLFRRLIELGADYTCRDPNEDTVLHLAAKHGHWEIVQYLLDLGERTDTPDSEGFLILHKVAAADTHPNSCRENILLSLLKHTPDVDEPTKGGDRAVHLAAKNGRWKTVVILIQNGANPLDCDSEGINVLVRMVKSPSSRDHATSILKVSVSVRKPQQHSRAYIAILHEAARCSNWDVVRFLVNQGVSMDQHDSEGFNLLHIAVTAKTPVYLQKTLNEIIKYFVDKGLDLNDRLNGNTSLHLAAKLDKWDVVKCLVEQGANIQEPDTEGVFLLQRLAMSRKFEKVHNEVLRVLIIKGGADWTMRQDNGDSLFHLAARANNWGFVSRIITLPSEVNVCELDSEGFNILHRLAQLNKSVNWTHIWTKGPNFDTPSKNGDTCLLFAARKGNWDFVRTLLEYINEKLHSDNAGVIPVPQCPQDQDGQVEVKLNLDQKDVCGYTVWHYAVIKKQWDIIRELARCGVNTDHIDDEGLNILQRMASDMEIDCQSIRETKDNILHLFKEDGLGNCPLQTAAARNISFEMVTLLLDHVRDVHSKDSDGIPLLHRVVHRSNVRNSSEFQEIVERLLNLGVDVEEQSWDGNLPLHLAAKCIQWSVVRLLLKYGARADVCDSEGLSVLHILACQNPTLPHIAERLSSIILAPLINELLQSGASLNQKDSQGNTPLHLAVQHQNWKVAQELVQCGAEVNELDPDGYTVLQRLAQIQGANQDQSFFSLLQLLLAKEARCDITSNRGETIFKILVENENWSMLKCLLTNGMAVINKQDYQSLCYCLTSSYYGDKHIDVCDLLIEKGSSVDAKDGDDNTALNRAAWAGNWRLVEHLIHKGASGRFVDRTGLSILHRFVHDRSSDIDNNTLGIIDVIISSGVDVNLTDPRGNTALHTAARFGLFEIVDRLLNYADNVNTKDSDGLTPLLRLSHSSSPKCLPLVERLVQQGADINICSTDGESPLHLAIKGNNWPVVEFLLNRGAQLDVKVLEQLYTVHKLIKCSTTTLSDKSQLNLMKHLTQKGVSVNSPDLNGKTPAELAVIYRKWDLLLNILQCVSNLNQNHREGNSFFHELARNSSLDANKANIITNQLDKCGLDINQQNSVGDTPAHLAADEENYYIVRIFVTHGADTNIPNRKGNCLLHTVVKNLSHESIPYQQMEPRVELVSLLVRHGADINRRGAKNKTALQMAAGKKDWEMVGGLVELGATCELTPDEKQLVFTILHCFTWEEIEESRLKNIINYITEDVTDINYPLSDKNKLNAPKTVLQGCIENSKWKMAKVLVECGAEVNKPFMELLISRYYSQPDCTKWIDFLSFLISQGFDINAKFSDGSTLLFFDETINSLLHEDKVTGSLFDILLEKGADPLLVDSRGQTLLRKVVDLFGYCRINGLKKLLAAGVTTHQPRVTQTLSLSQEFSEYIVSPTEKVIQDHDRWALEILVQSGASSNYELFRLNTKYQVNLAGQANRNRDVRELLKDLNKFASEPRSLQSLCRLSVSHWLGCGPGRSDKVNSLPIAPCLKHRISFCDLLSTEFLSHRREDLIARSSEEEDDLTVNNDNDDSDSSIDDYEVVLRESQNMCPDTFELDDMYFEWEDTCAPTSTTASLSSSSSSTTDP